MNLLVSLGFADTPDRPATSTQRVGLAVLDVCRSFVPGADLTLKWPNDVLLGGDKVAGILAQRSATSGAVVVGIGLNVAWAPPGAAALAPSGGPAVSSVLLAVLRSFDAVDADGIDVATRYRAELGTLGRDVRVQLPGGATIVGRASDVDATGRLVVVEDDGARHVLDVGDVVHATAI